VVAAARAEGWQVAAASASGRAGLGLDVRDPTAVRRLLAEVAPDAVVNATLAMDAAVDHHAAVDVARAVADLGVRLVHVSSDVVHGGREAPYAEHEAPTPCDWSYARDKAAAEQTISALGSDVVLPRASLVVGEHGEGPHDHFDRSYFSDMVRQPVVVTDLARLLLALVDLDVTGTLHAAGPQEVTRLEYARGLARRAGADPDAVLEARVADLDLPRPAVVRLDTTRAAGLGVRLRPVGEVVPL
jgi:dTDP-4-dehydrorhamnose reductase